MYTRGGGRERKEGRKEGKGGRRERKEGGKEGKEGRREPQSTRNSVEALRRAAVSIA